MLYHEKNSQYFVKSLSNLIYLIDVNKNISFKNYNEHYKQIKLHELCRDLIITFLKCKLLEIRVATLV